MLRHCNRRGKVRITFHKAFTHTDTVMMNDRLGLIIIQLCFSLPNTEFSECLGEC